MRHRHGRALVWRSGTSATRNPCGMGVATTITTSIAATGDRKYPVWATPISEKPMPPAMPDSVRSPKTRARSIALAETSNAQAPWVTLQIAQPITNPVSDNAMVPTPVERVACSSTVAASTIVTVPPSIHGARCPIRADPRSHNTPISTSAGIEAKLARVTSHPTTPMVRPSSPDKYGARKLWRVRSYPANTNVGSDSASNCARAGTLRSCTLNIHPLAVARGCAVSMTVARSVRQGGAPCGERRKGAVIIVALGQLARHRDHLHPEKCDRDDLRGRAIEAWGIDNPERF